MKKRMMLLTVAISMLAICGFAYANKNDLTLKAFSNSSGETVYYPVLEIGDTDNIQETVIKQEMNKSKAPETAKLGDVFLGEEGYEKVIAVNEDGAFVTELVNEEELNN